MKRMPVILSLFSGIIWSADTVWAERAYVTDSFEITFRTGPGTNHKIMRMLSSGQPVEVVREEGEWSLAELPVFVPRNEPVEAGALPVTRHREPGR